MDTLEAMERCYRQTESVVGALGPQHADLPTPCPLFDVRALYVHVIGVLDMFTAALHDEPYSARRGELFDGDPLATYSAAVDTNLAAWRARENLDGTLTLPFGTIPAAMGARLSTVDVLVHGWDFASATGQATSLPRISPPTRSGSCSRCSAPRCARTRPTHRSASRSRCHRTRR
jgi:uncharacterized protein (TIGR03086 family)